MGEPVMSRLLIENLATILAITGIIAFVALGPIGRAIARRSEGRDPGPADLGDVEGRLGTLEHQAQRVAELEERLDFAERMLAQRPDVARIPASPEGR